MVVTEVGRMGVKPGFDVTDDTARAGRILLGAWEKVITLPGGPHWVSWGVEIGAPEKLWAFMGWDSVEDHEKFAKTWVVFRVSLVFSGSRVMLTENGE